MNAKERDYFVWRDRRQSGSTSCFPKFRFAFIRGHDFFAYAESLAVLRRSRDAARLGDTDKLDGLARRERFTRAVERRLAREADSPAAVAHEHAPSPSAPSQLE